MKDGLGGWGGGEGEIFEYMSHNIFILDRRLVAHYP